MNRSAVRQMVREALGVRAMMAEPAEDTDTASCVVTYGTLTRCISYAIGATYAVGYDVDANKAWSGTFNRVRVLLDSAPIVKGTLNVSPFTVDDVTDAIMALDVAARQ